MSLPLTVLLSLIGCGGDAPTPADTPPAVEAPTPAAEAAGDARRIDVLVDGHGYTPAAIEATPGEPLRLVFKRLDENNCGGEVVFPDTGVKHALPVGEEVAVDVTAPAEGRLAFTCGMSMYEGAVVVSGG